MYESENNNDSGVEELEKEVYSLLIGENSKSTKELYEKVDSIDNQTIEQFVQRLKDYTKVVKVSDDSEIEKYEWKLVDREQPGSH